MCSNFPSPRKKYYFKENNNLPLPLFYTNNGDLQQFRGNFNGFSISIENAADALKVFLNGFFGKGNLSRSYPTFDKDKPSIIRKRQLNNRNLWSENALPEKIICIPDSDSDNEDYFKNMQPSYHIDKSNLKEQLVLNMEESFFLFDALKCLNIYHDNILLNQQDAWSLFLNTDQYFLQNYITYYYFRSKNWMVKPGLKFGGDYLLYKEGPAYYHASYVVIIDVIDKETLQRKQELCRRSMELPNIIGLHRLCETAGKELLICEIIWPNTPLNKPEDIKNVTIKEIIVNRWLLPNELDNNE